MKLLKIYKREDLRDWFIKNVNKEVECFVLVKKGRPDYSLKLLPYLDAVEEALCFGWIDSTTKHTDVGMLQKFVPRGKNSRWSELNKARVRRLENMGLMTDYGRNVLPDMKKFVIDDEILEAFKKEPIAYKNFKKFPKLYQIIRIDNIQGYKKDYTLFKNRLKKLIETSKENKMYGEWNDYGRLWVSR